MDTYHQWIAFYTMLRKDVVRLFRIWVQTFLPSVITSGLYFLIFGSLLGSRIGTMEGVPYMQFVVPGLVMMAIVTNAYANSSFTFFQSKFFARSIDELLVSPMPPWLMIAGSALAAPNDQNSGTASQTRSAADRCIRSPISNPLAITGPCARVTPLGAAVDPEV